MRDWRLDYTSLEFIQKVLLSVKYLTRNQTERRRYGMGNSTRHTDTSDSHQRHYADIIYILCRNAAPPPPHPLAPPSLKERE